jgi:hypothetical protein
VIVTKGSAVEVSSKQRELELLQSRVRELEAEIARDSAPVGWQTSRDYAVYHATVGALLGIYAAAASLLFNVIGALAAGKNPLQLIRVYLTFPLGENALRLTEGTRRAFLLSDGMIVALGCCLYLVTGMVLGIPIALAVARFAPNGSLQRRLIVGGAVALLIWALNFYGILSWLQPLLFGGRWIVDNATLPWWVAAATHLVFGCTIALFYPLVLPKPVRPAHAGR